MPCHDIGRGLPAKSVGTNTLPGTPIRSMIGSARSSTER
ncbi:MAG: hypothetical protein QOC95_154 [Thermoleophilaceae bacterium]|nr:hypothetical protein [Thermoleophilaceae bacterium]